MIVFDPFWQLLKERNITTYDLEYKYIISDEEQFYLAIHIENIMRKHVGL